jgi:hypothetical protein
MLGRQNRAPLMIVCLGVCLLVLYAAIFMWTKHQCKSRGGQWMGMSVNGTENPICRGSK